jgi:hypothetical protein
MAEFWVAHKISKSDICASKAIEKSDSIRVSAVGVRK